MNSSHVISSRRRPLLMVLIAGLAIVAVGSGSLALFTDTDQVGPNAFTASTIDLTASPASALISYTNMLPGDSVYGDLTLTNAGSGDLRYSMTSASTDSDGLHLETVLLLEIRQKVGATACATDFTGAVVFPEAAIQGAAFGDNTPGSQLGDRGLTSGSNEHLCFKARLDGTVNDSYQGSATTTTFTFDSEQTAHN